MVRIARGDFRSCRDFAPVQGAAVCPWPTRVGELFESGKSDGDGGRSRHKLNAVAVSWCLKMIATGSSSPMSLPSPMNDANLKTCAIHGGRSRP